MRVLLSEKMMVSNQGLEQKTENLFCFVIKKLNMESFFPVNFFVSG